MSESLCRMTLQYEVMPKRVQLFLKGIAQVIALMKESESCLHVRDIYSDAQESCWCLKSDWKTADDARGCIISDEYRLCLSAWGAIKVLSERPNADFSDVEDDVADAAQIA